MVHLHPQQHIKKEAEDFVVLWNGGDKFQCKGSWREQRVVDMSKKVCSCRRWELTGIPCKHAVATIWNMALNGQQVGIPEDWVHAAYKLDTWRETYSFKIQPTNGYTMWQKSACPTKLLPPIHRTQVGRPQKKRKRTAEEQFAMVKDGKLSRFEKTVTCGKCKQKGHNSVTCKGQSLSQTLRARCGGSQRGQGSRN